MAENVRNVIINPAYEPFFASQDRYAILYGSAGSGKSVSAAQKIIMRCLTETDSKHRFVVIRKVRNSLRHSVYELVKKTLTEAGLLDFVVINSADMVIKFLGSLSEIIFTGVDDPEKLKSLEVSGIWIEEPTELDEGDFKQIDLRLRGIKTYYSQIILTFNPISETHWLKRVFFDRKNDMTFILHTTYKDNMFIDEQYKRVLEERYIFDENMYRIYVKGEWGRIRTSQEWYYNFKYEKHVKPIEYIPNTSLHFSFDFNVNPYISCSVFQVERAEINSKMFFFVNCLQEFALANPFNNTESLCDKLMEEYADKMSAGVYIYGDATGRQRTTNSNLHNYDTIEEKLRMFLSNYSVRVPRVNPYVKRRRLFVNKVLYGGFNIEVAINTDCPHMIEDLEGTIEAEDGNKYKQMVRDPLSGVVYEKLGHFGDTLDYFLCSGFEAYYESFL